MVCFTLSSIYFVILWITRFVVYELCVCTVQSIVIAPIRIFTACAANLFIFSTATYLFVCVMCTLCVCTENSANCYYYFNSNDDQLWSLTYLYDPFYTYEYTCTCTNATSILIKLFCIRIQIYTVTAYRNDANNDNNHYNFIYILYY